MENKNVSAAVPASTAAGDATPESAEDNQDLSAIAAAAPGLAFAAATPGFAASDTAVSNLTKSTADTLCEVALKISSAALLINRAALVMKDLVNKDSSGGKVVLPSERSFRLSEERSSHTDAENLHEDPKDNC